MIVAYEVYIFPVKCRRHVSVCINIGDYGICSKYFQLSVKHQRNVFICEDVGDCGISGEYFSTLCEIPTEKFRLDIRW